LKDSLVDLLDLLHLVLSKEYLGGTEEALSLKGVAEFRVKNDDEKVKEGGTDDDLAYLDASN